jgi:hypothetical protein
MQRAKTDIASAIEQACLAAADELLRTTGFCPPPQIHLLIDEWDQPYVGCVATRPYRRGADAVEAIGRLGAAAANVVATRVVVIWEEADLRASISGPGDHPNGLAVLVATLTHHVLRWHPAVLHEVPRGRGRWPALRPDWGEPLRVENAQLAPVIVAVLDRWCALGDDSDTVFDDLRRDGYDVHLIER